MRLQNLLTRVAVASLLLVVVFVTSGIGSAYFGVAHAHPAPPSAPTDAGRFVPDINAPRLPVGSWTPPVSTVPTLKSHPAPSPTARTTRTVGEQADLRSAMSSTYLNSDGSWSLKSYPVPVHYQDAQGRWQNIDDTVRSDTSVAGYSYGNTANSWQVHFAQKSGGPQLLHLNYPGLTTAESLQGAAAVTGQASGSEMTYPGVFPGVDLLYLIGNAHLEETLLLQNAQTPTSYSFSYHVPGTTAKQDASGNIVFVDAKGNILMTVGGIAMYEADAHGQMLPQAQGTGKIAVTITGTSPNYTITLTPDQAWLSDPTRHFPVAIDPTFVGNQNGGYDTFAESGNAGSNFNTTNTERIGNCNAIPSGSTGYGTGTNRSFIKFGIGAAPAGVHLTSATMTLYQLSAYGGGTTINANLIGPSWDPTTLTWNNQPANSWTDGSFAESTTYNVTVSMNALHAVYDWWQNGHANNGLELQYANESVACDLFASDDRGISNELPTLTVNYVQDTTAPGAAVAINGGSSVTNNATVSLGTTVSDLGSITEWGSNWTSSSGIGSNGGTAPHWVTNGTQLTADTSTCGVTTCSVQTFIPSNASSWSNPANWPTFTAMFKTDLGGMFTFGAVASGNNNTRFDIVAAAGSSAFTTMELSTASGSYTTTTINIPFSANTWYYGQIAFSASNIGEIYLWPVGQARPASPSWSRYGIYMSQPGLNFWEQGNNGSGLHSYTIANVVATSKDTSSGTTGYGAYGMDFSNDGSSWSCPSGGTWCVGASTQPTWTLSAGDGVKTVSMRSIDNVGKMSGTATDQIMLDTTGPSASITGPAAGHDMRGVVTVYATATDPTASDGSHSGLASVSLFMDGVQVGNPVTTSSTPSFLWDTTNVASGRHMLTVRATDNAGNVGSASAGVTVSVSNTGQMGYETYALRDLPADGIQAGVNVATGTAVVTEQDIDIAGRGPDLALGRDYNDLSPMNNLFGWGWTSDLDEGLTLNADNSLTYYDASGGAHVYLPNGANNYITPPGLFLSLVKNADGSYTLTATDQTKTNFNSSGYLTSIKDRNGNMLTVTYTGTLPTTLTDASGRTLTLTTSGGHITHIAAPGSRTYDYAYDASGNLTNFTDPQGIVTHYDYDTSHRMTKITLNYQSGGPSDVQTNVATTLSYDTANRLVKLVDPLGFDAGISYGSPGTGSTTVQQLWTNATTTPSSTGSVYQATSYLMATDGSGALAELTDALGNHTFYTYNGNGLLTQFTDGNGTVTNSTYDGNGNMLTTVVDPGSGNLALTTTWTYDSANNVLTQTDPRGIVTKYTYDAPATGDLVTAVQHYVSGGATNSDTNVTTSSTYDSYGEALTATDALGVVSKYTYDGNGDVLTTTENYQQGVTPDDHTNVTTSATYDALGEQLTTTSALGIVTTTVYDIRGNVQQTTANYQAGGPSDAQTNVKTQYGYDALGRPITTTNPRGVVSKTVYDKDGREVQSIANYVSGGAQDSQTNVTSTTAYDGAGNATVATDAKGNTTTTTYDADNRAIETKVAGSGGAQVQDTKATYDAVGNTVSSQVMDGDNNPTTTSSYDAANRLLTQTDPPANPGASDQSGQSNVATYSYDATGDVLETKVTNVGLSGSGIVADTTATFGALGRQLSKTADADTGSPRTTNYVYNANGRPTSLTDEANHTTTSSYDALGRVVSVTHPDTTVDTTTYDAAGEQLAHSNSAGTTVDTYDPLGRVSTEQLKNGSGAPQGTVAYTYDVNGNVTQKVTTLADGSQVTTVSTYDALDRQATLNDGTRSYSYDLAGNVTHMEVLVSGSGYATQADSGYDGGNRLTSLYDKVGPAATILHSYGYTYDGNGNRSSIIEDGATTTNYTYDDLNQLTQEKIGSTVTASYTYDANHNRTRLVTPSGTTSYGYTSSDQLTQKTDPDGKVTTYGYDTQGNLTSATYDPTGVNQVTQYHYDANERMTEVDKPDGTTIQFGYDANFNRTTKTITSGGVSHSVTDIYVLGHLSYETGQNGTVLATFTYDSNGVPVSVQVGSDPNTSPRYYYVYNGHGDVVALVDAQGNVAASYTYDAFGQLTAASETFGGTTTWTNPYRYDGRNGVRYDGETGLYWMSVRAYDPVLGRFLSRDPLGRAPLFFSDQPYVYGGNNPLINVDPSGQRFLAADMGQVRSVRAKTSAGGKKRVKEKRGRSLRETRGGRSGGERAQTANEGEGAPNDAAWRSADPSERFTIWLGQMDKPDGGTDYYHVNLHIRQYRSTVDLFNFHIWYFGYNGMADRWMWKNYVPGVSEHEQAHELDFFALDMPSFLAVAEVMDTLLGEIQKRSEVPILFSITDHVDKSGKPGGTSLYDALSKSLIELRDKYWSWT